MIQTDCQYYKTVMSAVGRTMLIFLLLINVYGAGINFLSVLLDILSVGEIAGNVIYQVVYAVGYMAVFMLPVLFLRRSLRKYGCPTKPMSLSVRLSPMLVPILFAGITVCFAMAEINSFIVDLFGYSDFMAEMMGTPTGEMAPYEIILDFIVVCVVPAFCEEFLFRGAILTNCRPFGRTNAILISAALFALMHQNVGQLLYTFAAGIVLGLVYEYTGSIWNCTILHLFNNFVSVSQNVILAEYGETTQAWALLTAIEVVIYLLGAISIGILVSKHFSKHQTLEDGVFEKTVPAADSYAEHPVRGRISARLFFCPSIIIFVVLATIEMGSLVLLSLTT